MAQSFSNTILQKRDHADFTSPSGRQVVLSSMTIGDTYPDGGFAISAANVGLTTIDRLYPFPTAGTGVDDLGFVWIWDRVAGKLKGGVTGSAGGAAFAEVTTGATVSTEIVDMIVVGY